MRKNPSFAISPRKNRRLTVPLRLCLSFRAEKSSTLNLNDSEIGMDSQFLSQLDLEFIRQQFDSGSNVTDLLKAQLDTRHNSPEIIEIAYDLQAGEYIDFALKNKKFLDAYTDEIAGVLDEEIQPNDHLLDVGTGELTTFSYILKKLKKEMRQVSALDLSWSRLHKGRGFSREFLSTSDVVVNTFAANMERIPFSDGAVDVVISSHALEPNRGRLRELLDELMRIARRSVILFEPYYEGASADARRRMDKLGYIKGIESTVESVGGRVLRKFPMKHVSNPLNPTFCFVIQPREDAYAANRNAGFSQFTLPGTNEVLVPRKGGYYSVKSGFYFPTLNGIPILKTESAILASALNS